MNLEEIFNDDKQYKILMLPYRRAAHIIKTKLESIDDELKCENGQSPIHNIDLRIKSSQSLLDKLNRKNLPHTILGMQKIHDIAGLRVVCHYMNDTQYIAQLLIMHEDIELIEKENYIDYPKENGYRSLHLVVKVHVYLKDGIVDIPVEIQLRTIAMDCWASLEHELMYKNPEYVSSDIYQRLKECANMMEKTDKEMQRIYQELHNHINSNQEI